MADVNKIDPNIVRGELKYLPPDFVCVTSLFGTPIAIERRSVRMFETCVQEGFSQTGRSSVERRLKDPTLITMEICSQQVTRMVSESYDEVARLFEGALPEPGEPISEESDRGTGRGT